MQYRDTIKLRFGHNLVVGNTPDVVALDNLGKILEKESHLKVESFGLFETATPNYTTYYPDVTAEDLKPKDSDFITPTYRALSEVVVHRKWNPVDFSVGGILKKSMNLLIGQSVYADHETALGNAMGAIMGASWQEAYTAEGVKVPAGINTQLKIDGKSNPRIARGILMDPPSIHSSSVTVEFLWKKSHDALDEREFFNKLGSFDKDGQLIRRIATKINRYHEISLVGHGADPFAQKVDENGKIVNPTYAGISNNSEAKKSQKIFFFDFKSEILQNSEDTIPDESNTSEDQVENTENDNTQNNPNMEFLKLIATMLSLADTATEQEVETKLKEVIAANTKATSDVTSLTTEKDALKTAKTTLETFQNTVLEKKRGEVLRLYKLTVKTPVDAIVNSITAMSDLATLEAFEEQYRQQADSIAPLTCKSCGSKDVNRASASQEEDKHTSSNSEDTDEPEDLKETAARLKERALRPTVASQMHS